VLALKRKRSSRPVVSERTRAFKELKQWFFKSQRIVIVGIGNPIRRDDNIGVEIVSGLEGNVSETVLLIKSETVPESFIEPIIEFQPTNILIIDAALLNLSPGSMKLVKSLKGSKTAISTHALPIQIFCEYLIKMTQAEVAMLLIQPRDTRFGEGLTPELDVTRRTIIQMIQSVVN